jgi:hypothetical protein
MAVKLNSEFNYRYQVIGETPWEKIKTLKGFLEGRVRAAALEKVADLKHQALVLEIEHLIRIDALPHVILTKQAELLELESHFPAQKEAFELNREEIEMLKRLLAELYEIAERIPGYTDEQMFEANAANEFTVTIGKDIQAEIIANGRPSSAKLRNAMSNPHTFAALKQCGLVPETAVMLEGSNSALRIELKPKVLE